jgi:peptidoglycan/LPS O-acetylase OafA/YrhL
MTALRVSALLTLIGLGFMVWSMIEPTPLPVMLAMSVGQALGTLAFGIYLYVVVHALRRDYRRVPPRDPS